MAKRKKKRVMWAVGQPTRFTTDVSTGLVFNFWFTTKRHAKLYGNPVKFIEA